ncbi:hypothetical protein Vlu01_24710 [Micromonospora lutea]|uniref:Uncharacterized protein n=1 Tax=Micromonospora lutea TaxID=419825 RepID=A0ABQ4IVA4_9ACTN|nr:hypothetical protein Vlu01_24710 [Micromonospora lutea]
MQSAPTNTDYDIVIKFSLLNLATEITYLCQIAAPLAGEQRGTHVIAIDQEGTEVVVHHHIGGAAVRGDGTVVDEVADHPSGQAECRDHAGDHGQYRPQASPRPARGRRDRRRRQFLRRGPLRRYAGDLGTGGGRH